MKLLNPPENPYDYNVYCDTPDGNRYHWDPDFQVWFQVITDEQYARLSHWEKYSWLYWSLACVVVSVMVLL